jgi:hypothetical protein
MKIHLLPLLFAFSAPVNADDFSEQLSKYLQATANTRWSQSREVVVQNLAAVDDTLAVVVPVTGGPEMAYVVVDESSRPIVTQSDDLDGDGTVDEVCSLLKLRANEQRMVVLLSAEADLPPAPSDLILKHQTAGSWEPVRMQPTSSPGNTQMSYYRSPANAALARKLIARLDSHMPMELVACDDFRVLIGHNSGLVEGMRPANLPTGMMGSYLREFLPMEANEGEPNLGPMTRRFSGPVRCGFQWGDGKQARRITVYRNGLIETTWATAPATLQVITCAYPYQYLQAGSQDAVRFSQLLQKRRDLPRVDTISLFGRDDASLLVAANGLQAIDHQVWLDGGEIGWEVNIDVGKRTSHEEARERVTRWAADTYVAGGMHVTSWQGERNRAELSYRIGDFGGQASNAGLGLVRVTAEQVDNNLPVVKQPSEKSDVTVNFEITEMTVNRLYPNDINGWELRPVTLARRNPQPAYFAAELVNHSEQETIAELSLEDADWIREASVLSQREMLTHERFGDQTIPYYHDVTELVPGGAAIRVVVPAESAIPIEVVIRPKDGTLGLLQCRLRTGEEIVTDLSVMVRPTILFMPKSSGINAVARELANVEFPAGAPFSYGVRFWGGYTPELTQWYKAAHIDAERNGFWTLDPLQMRHLATVHGEEVAAGGAGVDIEDWTEKTLAALSDPAGADYRVRIYLHDEIWEVLGRQGHFVVPVQWMIDADRRVVMNSPNGAWSSFQEPAMNPPFQYHLKLANDIAELFYYCGRDMRLQAYARKLVEPRTKLFDQWRADPDLLARAGTDSPRQLISFWISTQLHVADYSSVRRQVWWLRHHGIDSINSWACNGGYGPALILHWMLMDVQSDDTLRGRGSLLTDRALGWIDMKEDMELVTLVRLLADEVEDETTQQELAEISQQALEASQREEFELARHLYVTALEKLRPDLLYLAPRNLYRGPVEAEALPDLFADDINFREAQRIPKTRVRLFKEGRRPTPTVDGILDNAFLEVGTHVQMRENREGRQATTATDVYVVRDEKDLYLFFNCNEPKMEKLRTELTERDSGVWSDDCIEVFIDRSGDEVRYAHFIVSAADVRYDSRNDIGVEWNPEYETAVLREAESWSAELRIPFEELGGAPERGETWRMNFCRVRKTAGTEVNAWSATFGGLLSPGRFGFVQFK